MKPAYFGQCLCCLNINKNNYREETELDTNPSLNPSLREWMSDMSDVSCKCLTLDCQKALLFYAFLILKWHFSDIGQIPFVKTGTLALSTGERSFGHCTSSRYTTIFNFMISQKKYGEGSGVQIRNRFKTKNHNCMKLASREQICRT